MAWNNGDYPTLSSLTDNDVMLLAQSGITSIGLLSTLKTYMAASSVGLLNSDTTLAGTPASTAKTALRTYSLPAATLNTDGWFVRAIYFGSIAATAGTKRVFFAFGSTEVDSGASAFSSVAGRWVVEAIVRRNAAGNQDMLTRIYMNTGTTWTGEVSGYTSFDEPAENLNGNVSLTLSGQNGGAVASDILYQGSIILLNS